MHCSYFWKWLLSLLRFQADIPVVAVSLHSSLDPATHLAIGHALSSLREDNVLILGSGYTFHNMNAFSNPSPLSHQASVQFNEWLKHTIMKKQDLSALKDWEKAPGARVSHPREEHLLPLFVVAGAAIDTNTEPHLIYDTTLDYGDHAVTGYAFS